MTKLQTNQIISLLESIGIEINENHKKGIARLKGGEDLINYVFNTGLLAVNFETVDEGIEFVACFEDGLNLAMEYARARDVGNGVIISLDVLDLYASHLIEANFRNSWPLFREITG